MNLGVLLLRGGERTSGSRWRVLSFTLNVISQSVVQIPLLLRMLHCTDTNHYRISTWADTLESWHFIVFPPASGTPLLWENKPVLTPWQITQPRVRSLLFSVCNIETQHVRRFKGTLKQDSHDNVRFLSEKTYYPAWKPSFPENRPTVQTFLYIYLYRS